MKTKKRLYFRVEILARKNESEDWFVWQVKFFRKIAYFELFREGFIAGAVERNYRTLKIGEPKRTFLNILSDDKI